MDHPFSASREAIERLGDIELTGLLKLLLRLEARKAGIAARNVDVSLSINVPDGGEDGRISWSGAPSSTDYLPSNINQFQVKASELGPSDCARELINKAGNVKEAIDDCLSQGGHYVLFINQGLNRKTRKSRIDRMREALRNAGAPYSDSAELHVFDSNIIQDWVNDYIPAVAHVGGSIGKPLLPGVLSWEEWSRTSAHLSHEFVADELRANAIAEIRATLSERQTSYRVVGLAGLGKTRLALEATKPDDSGPGLSDLVVYINAAHKPSNLLGHVADWVRLQYRGLLVVDNCELSLHAALREQVERPESYLSLLTLDYDLAYDGRTPTTYLEPLSQKHTETLITNRYGRLIRDPDRLARFAQGFPQLAIMLAEGRRSDEASGAALSDDELLKRLIWGKESPSDEALSALRACAVFDTLGVLESARGELDFVATQLADTTPQRFYKIMVHFAKRGIIDWRGRYIRVVPLPLAIRLAGSCWEAVAPEFAHTLIQQPMPERLASSLCARLSVLDQVPEIHELTTQLFSPGGALSSKETLLSPRGVRIFRSLVGVNPEATASALEREFATLGHQDLLHLASGVRRELVAALERLAFRESQFPRAAGILLRLASAETENYTNNARGQFIQLFSTVLSGTQASPETRLRCVDQWLGTADSNTLPVLIDALAKGIDLRGNSRAVGAEHQGSGAPLEEWRPRVWAEAHEYWDACLQRLTQLATADDDHARRAQQCLGLRLGALINAGRIESVSKTVHSVAESIEGTWPEAIQSLKQVKSYHMDRLSGPTKEKVDGLLELLAPSTSQSRFQQYVKDAPFEHTRNPDGGHIDVSANRACEVAEELAKDTSTLFHLLPDLTFGPISQGSAFGRALAENLERPGDFARMLVDQLALVDPARWDWGVLFGMLVRIAEVDHIEWESILQRVADSKSVAPLYTALLSSGPIQRKHLDRVVSLVDSDRSALSSTVRLSMGRALDSLPPDDVSAFTQALCARGGDAAWVGLVCLFMYCFGRPASFGQCRGALLACMEATDFQENRRGNQIATHHWKEVGEWFAENGTSAEVDRVLRRVFAMIEGEQSISDLHQAARPVLQQLLQHRFGHVWPDLKARLSAASGVAWLHYEMLIEAEDFEGHGESLLDLVPDDELILWCATEPQVAPRLVGRTIQVIKDDADSPALTDIVLQIIDQLGANTVFLDAIMANLVSGGWVGSMVPRLEQQRFAIEPLTRHSDADVRAWATQFIQGLDKQIKEERQRDDEEEFGIR